MARVCTHCEQECSSKEIKQVYDTYCAASFSGLRPQVVWEEVSDCCEAEFTERGVSNEEEDQTFVGKISSL